MPLSGSPTDVAYNGYRCNFDPYFWITMLSVKWYLTSAFDNALFGH